MGAPGAALAVSAPAKVNLVLAVHPQPDARGYHAVSTVMAALALADGVGVRPCPDVRRPLVSCVPDLGIPAEQNLAYRAARALGDALGIEPAVHIEIEKAIPAEAGLGGGSSDAAATIRALCGLWGVDPNDPRVGAVARSLGADVPFFLGPSPALLGDRGDVVERALPEPPGAVVLVRPPGPGVSTPAAYRAFDAQAAEPGFRPADPAPLVEALEAGSLPAVAAALANDLERAACELNPAVGRALAWLRGQPGVLGAQVSGSGSALFALCDDSGTARRVAGDAARRGCWSRATAFAGE